MGNHTDELDAQIAALKAELQEWEAHRVPAKPSICVVVVDRLKKTLREKEIEKTLQEIRESMTAEE